MHTVLSSHPLRHPMLGYSLKISLEKSYRTVAVPKDITFGDLHRVIMTVMGWTGYHLHEFEIGGRGYVITNPEYDLMTRIVDEDTEYLRDYENCRITYVYDFGDWWKHTVTFGKDVEIENRTPKLLKCKGPGPIEDSGGQMEYDDDLDPAELAECIDYCLSFMTIPEATGIGCVKVPSWSSLPLSFAVFMPRGIPLFLDPASGGVFSTEDTRCFPRVDEEETEGMIPILDGVRHGIEDVALEVFDNTERDTIRVYNLIFGQGSETAEPQPPEFENGDPYDAYRTMPPWLVQGFVSEAEALAYDAAEDMDIDMPPADFIERPDLALDRPYGYDLMFEGFRCPECFRRLSNPTPVENGKMFKCRFTAVKPLRMSCVGCGKGITLIPAPPTSEARYWFAENGFEASMTTYPFDPSEEPYEDMNEANAQFSLGLLMGLRPRHAVRYAESASGDRRDRIKGICTAVLGVCEEIGREEMKERVASIRDIDGTDPTVRCILCALNMGYGLDDRRFTEGIFEEQTKGMSDVGRRRILIIAAGILRRSGHPKKAAELAERALTDRLGSLNIQALDEYVRSSIEAGERPVLDAYRELEKDRMRRLKMESSNCVRYRIGAASLLNGSVHAAEVDLRGFISSTFSGCNDDPWIQARASCAALVLHHRGVRYNKKNLITISIKWMCSAVKANIVSDAEFEDYLKAMLPLALSEMPEADIRKSLKKNGFGDIPLPDVSGKVFNPAEVVSLDAQYVW